MYMRVYIYSQYIHKYIYTYANLPVSTPKLTSLTIAQVRRCIYKVFTMPLRQ